LCPDFGCPTLNFFYFDVPVRYKYQCDINTWCYVAPCHSHRWENFYKKSQSFGASAKKKKTIGASAIKKLLKLVQYNIKYIS